MKSEIIPVSCRYESHGLVYKRCWKLSFELVERAQRNFPVLCLPSVAINCWICTKGGFFPSPFLIKGFFLFLTAKVKRVLIISSGSLLFSLHSRTQSWRWQQRSLESKQNMLGLWPRHPTTEGRWMAMWPLIVCPKALVQARNPIL